MTLPKTLIHDTFSGMIQEVIRWGLGESKAIVMCGYDGRVIYLSGFNPNCPTSTFYAELASGGETLYDGHDLLDKRVRLGVSQAVSEGIAEGRAEILGIPKGN